MSVFKTTWLSVLIGYDICATEGLLTLMKGSNVFALKRVFDWSSRYLFADLFESLFVALKKGAPLTVAQKSAASLLGGVFSTCVTLPLDVLVAKTQDAKKAGVRVSAVRLFRDELKERGWSGLQKAYMQGFEARLLHVCLTTLGTMGVNCKLVGVTCFSMLTLATRCLFLF
jgi:Mitochondrial carrier protein